MDELEPAVAAVRALADREGGRLVVVSPTGVRGNPYDPDHVDRVEASGAALSLSLGDGHALYVLDAPRLLDTDDLQVRLGAERLTETLLPYGGGPARTRVYTSVELLVTADPAVAKAEYRTRGAYQEES